MLRLRLSRLHGNISLGVIAGSGAWDAVFWSMVVAIFGGIGDECDSRRILYMLSGRERGSGMRLLEVWRAVYMRERNTTIAPGFCLFLFVTSCAKCGSAGGGVMDGGAEELTAMGGVCGPCSKTGGDVACMLGNTAPTRKIRLHATSAPSTHRQRVYKIAPVKPNTAIPDLFPSSLTKLFHVIVRVQGRDRTHTPSCR